MPYNPNFLAEVRDGNVKEISSRGDTVQGEFRKEVKYKEEAAKGFETEIPTFANEQELSELLTENNVTVNAEPPNSRSLLETILFSFGPTILLVALFVFIARRAAGAGGAGGMLSQSAVRGPSAWRPRRSRSTSRTSRASRRPRTSGGGRGLPAKPGEYAKLGARIPPACCLSGAPGKGKTLLAGPWPVRRACPAYRPRHPSSSRRSSASARRGVRDLFVQAKEPRRPHLHR